MEGLGLENFRRTLRPAMRAKPYKPVTQGFDVYGLGFRVGTACPL